MNGNVLREGSNLLISWEVILSDFKIVHKNLNLMSYVSYMKY